MDILHITAKSHTHRSIPPYIISRLIDSADGTELTSEGFVSATVSIRVSRYNEVI